MARVGEQWPAVLQVARQVIASHLESILGGGQGAAEVLLDPVSCQALVLLAMGGESQLRSLGQSLLCSYTRQPVLGPALRAALGLPVLATSLAAAVAAALEALRAWDVPKVGAPMSMSMIIS